MSDDEKMKQGDLERLVYDVYSAVKSYKSGASTTHELTNTGDEGEVTVFEPADSAQSKSDISIKSLSRDVQEYARMISTYLDQGVVNNSVQIRISSGTIVNSININNSTAPIRGSNDDKLALEIKEKLTSIVESYWLFKDGQFQPVLKKLIASAEKLYGPLNLRDKGDDR